MRRAAFLCTAFSFALFSGVLSAEPSDALLQCQKASGDSPVRQVYCLHTELDRRNEELLMLIEGLRTKHVIDEKTKYALYDEHERWLERIKAACPADPKHGSRAVYESAVCLLDKTNAQIALVEEGRWQALFK